ncbi:MAG: PP2C family serine/threonine-protein phosphatase [Acidimicrobiales bacterium]
MSELAAVCPVCAEPAASNASWCEACGADLDAPAPGPQCVGCDAPPSLIGPDRYCGRCGRKQPAARDHLELDLGDVAAVTDKGNRHHHNEDAVAVARTEHGAVLVVCDGVGSTVRPEDASEAAVGAALEVLVVAQDAAGSSESMTKAALAAQRAVLGVMVPPETEHPPSSTFVAATSRIEGTSVHFTVAWLGDSRAYWVDATGATQISVDDAWGREQVASGVLTVEQAAAAPTANSITRWLGRDAVDVTPSIAVHETTQPGHLVLCSDGLWNYAADEASLAALIDEGRELSPIDLARSLVEFANDSGGHDNITVAISQHGSRGIQA